MVEDHKPLEAFWDYTCVAGKLHNLRTKPLPTHKTHTASEFIDNLQSQINDATKVQLALLQALNELYKHLDNSKCVTR